MDMERREPGVCQSGCEGCKFSSHFVCVCVNLFPQGKNCLKSQRIRSEEDFICASVCDTTSVKPEVAS